MVACLSRHFFSFDSFFFFFFRNVFERISAMPDLASLRQSLRIFIKHFVGKAKISKTYKGTDLEGRLKLVDGILGASDAIKL